MDIRARLYPHPVLTSYSDDYIYSEFSFNVNIENTDNDIRLKFNIILDNFNEERKICNSRCATGTRPVSSTVFRFQGAYIKKKETP